MLEAVLVGIALLSLLVAAWACSVVRENPEIIKPPKTRRCWICGDHCLDLDKEGKS